MLWKGPGIKCVDMPRGEGGGAQQQCCSWMVPATCRRAHEGATAGLLTPLATTAGFGVEVTSVRCKLKRLPYAPLMHVCMGTKRVHPASWQRCCGMFAAAWKQGARLWVACEKGALKDSRMSPLRVRRLPCTDAIECVC
jgi:hypothetical protein